MPRIRSILSVMLGAMPACAPTEPRLFGETILEPPPSYRTWWTLVEGCSKLTGSFDGVQWYVAAFVDAWDRTVQGAWFEDGNRIVLDDSVLTDGRVVRHEMLHALLRKPGHPSGYFAEACAPLVACESRCAPPEAERGVPAGAPEVLPSDLEIAMRIEPAQPSWLVDDGWLRIIVTATNPRPEGVWVRMPGLISFSFTEVGPVPDGHPPHESHGITRTVAAVEARWAFRANEQRSTTFDVRWPEGTYHVHVGFGQEWKGPFVVHMDP